MIGLEPNAPLGNFRKRLAQQSSFLSPSARHELAWHEIDMSWIGIRCLQMVGLLKPVRSSPCFHAGPAT